MRYYFIILIFLTACGTIKTKHTQEVEAETKNNYAVSVLEGHWTLVSIEIIEEKQSIERYHEVVNPNIAKEWSPPVYIDNEGILRPHSPSAYLARTMKDLVFNGDSIFRMNYPLQMETMDLFTIESERLIVKNDNPKSVVVSADKDSLYVSYLDQFGLYLKETYKRVVFDDSVLTILKVDTINIPELAGSWELIREDGDEYGTEYFLDFPYEVPDTLVLTKEELISTFYTDRSVQMLTDGKKQKYFLKYYQDELLLIPDKWFDPTEWHEKDRYVHDFLRFRRVN